MFFYGNQSSSIRMKRSTVYDTYVKVLTNCDDWHWFLISNSAQKGSYLRYFCNIIIALVTFAATIAAACFFVIGAHETRLGHFRL
jgi:hypothetical protein